MLHSLIRFTSKAAVELFDLLDEKGVPLDRKNKVSSLSLPVSPYLSRSLSFSALLRFSSPHSLSCSSFPLLPPLSSHFSPLSYSLHLLPPQAGATVLHVLCRYGTIHPLLMHIAGKPQFKQLLQIIDKVSSPLSLPLSFLLSLSPSLPLSIPLPLLPLSPFSLSPSSPSSPSISVPFSPCSPLPSILSQTIHYRMAAHH